MPDHICAWLIVSGVLVALMGLDALWGYVRRMR